MGVSSSSLLSPTRISKKNSHLRVKPGGCFSLCLSESAHSQQIRCGVIKDETSRVGRLGFAKMLRRYRLRMTMTTTIFDVEQKTAASDSRWSMDLTAIGKRGFVAYVDDTGFDKLGERPTHVISLAGDAELIGMWKAWWAADELMLTHPPVELGENRSISLSIIGKQSNAVEFDCGPKLTQACSDTAKFLAVFAGSGAQFAAINWGVSRCPREAVASAMEQDPYTGGEYKYVNYGKPESNLGPVVHDVDVIHQGILKEGRVMEIGKNESVPLSEFLDAESLKAAIDARQVVAHAPLSAQNNFRWTPERKERLESVLDSIRRAESNLSKA